MRTRGRKARGLQRSPCPVASTLDIIGDKWSLLIVRDMICGRSTYSELADSPEGIPTNILADRLRRLEDAGLLARSAYQDHPVRYSYSLTDKGRELGDLVQAFVRWGKKHIPGTITYDEAAAAGARPGRSAPAQRIKRSQEG
jgi:DNA-binding HxlR family transcriptional regulator